MSGCALTALLALIERTLTGLDLPINVVGRERARFAVPTQAGATLPLSRRTVPGGPVGRLQARLGYTRDPWQVMASTRLRSAIGC